MSGSLLIGGRQAFFVGKSFPFSASSLSVAVAPTVASLGTAIEAKGS